MFWISAVDNLSLDDKNAYTHPQKSKELFWQILLHDPHKFWKFHHWPNHKVNFEPIEIH